MNISSAAGLRSTGTGSVYAMTKAAMVQLTKNLACPGTKTWRSVEDIYGPQLLVLDFCWLHDFFLFFFVKMKHEGNSKSHVLKEDILCCGSEILIVVERFEVECLDSGPWVENLIPETRETQRKTRSQYLISRRLAAYK